MVPRTHRRPALIGTYTTILESQAVPYTVKRSSRAKHVRLEVRIETGLTVVIPGSYKTEKLLDLLRTKSRWILSKLAELGKVQSFVADVKRLKDGDSIPYLGRHLKVLERHNPSEAASVRLEKNQLLVNLGCRNGHLNLIMEWWYRQQAEKFIKERADELCSLLGVTYDRLSIRRAKTRWGSCSRKGNLSFNWKLMMVPEPVIDYVIIHELAHLREMNHSKNFWKLVDKHCPQWRKHRRWLKDQGTRLTARSFD